MKSVRNAAKALALFGAESTSISVTDVSVALDISMSAASRLLGTLRDEGVLEQDDSRRYRPGIVGNQLGLVYRSQNKLPELIVQAARELSARSGFTTWTSVLSQTDVLLLARFPGDSQHQFHVDPGSRLPAHASAAGKALLALLPDTEIRRLYADARLVPKTRRSLATIGDLLSDLALVRMRRWAEVNEELFLGIRSLAGAVQGLNEPTAMAISVSFPVSRFSRGDVREIAEHLIASCEWVGRRVGDPRWSSRPGVSTFATGAPAVKRQRRARAGTDGARHAVRRV
ncbi:MAG: IclR family transcriptional regulator C-terminal domain-containing protein [Burkholderiales bacterium]